MFLRQTFGLGGEQETLEGGAEPAVRKDRRLAPHHSDRQVRSARHFRRQYIHQGYPQRFHELDAVDYSADKVGVTYGAVADLNFAAAIS